MKKINFVTILFLTFITTTVFAGKEGGGGIIIAAEFATTGRAAIEILSSGDSQMDLKVILDSIKDTKIIPVDNICYIEPVLNKEYCEDAHYDAQNNMVLLAFQKWDSFICKEKLVLSAHELLRAAGLESEDYSYSGRFINGKIAQCEGLGGTKKQQLACADLALSIDSEIRHLCENLAVMARDRKNQQP